MDTHMENKFHFPTEIEITNSPLIEAWIEIKWELESGDIPGFLFDKAFPFALGVFFNNVKEKYSFVEELDSSKAPEGMIPNSPQYRFRIRNEGWPLLQLGPGIATLNFTNSYNWKDFKKECIYLQTQLIEAYKSKPIKASEISLHYRNSYPFNFSKNSILDFINNNLNTKITLPNYIPGFVANNKYPTTTRLVFDFELGDPKSIGTIKYGTGIRQENKGDVKENHEIVMWEYELKSTNDNTPDVNQLEAFSTWLEKAHSVVHEWFFSTIDGKLFTEFTSEESK